MAVAAAFRSSKVMISSFRSLITTTTSSKNNNHLSSSSFCYHRRQFSSLFTASSHDDKTVLSIETSRPFIAHKCKPPSTTVETTPEEIIRFYKNMSIMRRVQIAAAYKPPEPTLVDRQQEEEAVVVGLEAALTKKDFIITASPHHSTYLAGLIGSSTSTSSRRRTLIEVFAESMMKMDMQYNLYEKDENGFYSNVPRKGVTPLPALGCGLALEQKYYSIKGNVEGNVTFTMCRDDDYIDDHQLFKAFKVAAVLKLPAILVCENNNRCGMGMMAKQSQVYYKRGDFVPGLKVDGMDVFAVKQACEFAKEYSLQNGAIVLQMDKCWYHGQSLSDVRLERDPIERVRKLILSHGLATEKELEDFEKEIRKEVVHIKERTVPDPSEVSANVNVIGDGDEEQSSHNCQQNASNSGFSAFAAKLNLLLNLLEVLVPLLMGPSLVLVMWLGMQVLPLAGQMLLAMLLAMLLVLLFPTLMMLLPLLPVVVLRLWLRLL